MNSMPRPEHPKPQMQRESWLNLNGQWDFSFDFGNSGIERKFFERKELDQRILVPFCPESDLSGIGYKDFIPAVWYLRKVELTKEQLEERVRLHFGAVDYECRVWVNGQAAGSHKGGYASFVFDITKYVNAGENVIVVYAADNNRSGLQCKGKQSSLYHSHGCDYTRTTGIWQTVWMEFVPENYIEKVWYYPNIAEGTLTIKAKAVGSGTLCAEAFYEGKSCGSAEAAVTAGNAHLVLKLSELHLWELGAGRLYDLKLTFGQDCVNSYFGMREVCMDGLRFLLNGKSVFQRLVLDQGFYPDGIYTAPTDEMLERDIHLSLAAGFNGARLHQKIFEERFLYHCDRLGYMVWGEQGNWGLDYSDPRALKCFLPEWMEALERDFNHPAIVGWCPFNETWDYEGRRQDNDLLMIVYLMTKQYDTTRPCIDTSGNYHVITDIFDVHDYEQNAELFAERIKKISTDGVLIDQVERNPAQKNRQHYNGEPIFMSEYGGIGWDESQAGLGWGYGNRPKTKEELLERYAGLTNALLDCPEMMGFCYTQLYDVEQEMNGLYTYERKPKFNMDVIRAINARRAAIEE